MNFSTINHYLMPIAFTFLLLLMLLYWSEAAFFGFALPLHGGATPLAAPAEVDLASKTLPNALKEESQNAYSKEIDTCTENSNKAKQSKPKKVSWRKKYKIFTNFIFFLSLLSLTSLIVFRWMESGHFPLSNLYESLLFLAWCFLSLKVVFLTSYKYTSRNTLFEKNLNNSPVKKDEFSKSSVIPQIASEDSLQNKESTFSDLGLGVILSPLSLLTFGFAFLSLPKEMQQSTSLVPALQSNWLMMHVTVMVLSYAALISGSILSIAFLILNRVYINKSSVQMLKVGMQNAEPSALLSPYGESIKSSYKSEICTSTGDAVVAPYQSTFNPAKAMHLNLSSRLDNLSYRILALGFPLLTIGILSGAVWANEAWGSYWSWDPKETWALITWLVFAIYLHTRITKGWSGEKPAIVASVGFFMVWFCYLGVNLLGSGLHSYGWFSK